jgi:ferrous iron transport protein B
MIYHVPPFSVVLKQTWARTKSLIWIVVPVYIIGSAFLQAFSMAGIPAPVNALLAPVAVLWPGLPAVVGITLISGIVRWELVIVTLAVIFGTTNVAAVLFPVQPIVLALVSMLKIPCILVILVLASEFGWKKALAISTAEIVMAIAIGGIAFRVLNLLM